MNSEIFLTTIVPCLNEARVLEKTVHELNNCLASFPSYEILIVDDGSSDGTWEQVIEMTKNDNRIHGLRLSRNFGHQAAICAGLAHSKGRFTAIIDADLQDPPSVLVEMVKVLEKEKADVVYGIRKEREGVGVFYRACYSIFYKTFFYLTGLGQGLEAGDFRVVNRRIVDEINKLPESERYIRGLISWLGFRQVGFEYIRPQRSLGSTKYNFKKLYELAVSGITSFSILPLRFATACAGFSAVFAILVASWAVVDRYYLGTPPRGWTSIIVVLLGLGTIHFLLLGVIGEYLGKVFLQTKNRPTYIIAEYSKARQMNK